MTLDGVNFEYVHPERTVGQSTETLTDIVDAGVNSNILDSRPFNRKMFYIKSTLNVSITLQLKGSRTSSFTESYNVGDLVVLLAGNITPQKAILALSDHHAFLRFFVDPSGASVGSLLIEFSGSVDG